MVRVAIALLLLVLLPSAAWAQAEKRIALLIGNQSYDASVGKLKNPHNDIALVGDALTRQGFEVLPLVKDARRGAILGAVRDLVRRLNAAGSGTVGFIYYSGHGAAEKDTSINYLIPVDAKEPGTTTFWDESLKLDDILRLLDGARSAAKFIVFDACRNELQLPTKDTTKGLVPVAEQQGMFIAYASAPGRTASDRGDRSGPYAAALAAELSKTGLDHLNLFQNVKEAVLEATAGAQQPWESNGLGRRVYLTGAPKPGEPPKAPVLPAQPDRSELERAAAFIRETEDQSRLETFIKQFGDSPYAEMARARLQELKKKQVAIATPPKTAPASSARCDGIETLVGSQRRCLKPKDTFKDCPDCPEMVVVPAGEFMAGSQKVSIGKPFAVGRLEVTLADWNACKADASCRDIGGDHGAGRGKPLPVLGVSWGAATNEYLPWLIRKTEKIYRLLTEAEWDYAAGTGGNRLSAFAPHDMSGKVLEWVADCFSGSNTNVPADGRAAPETPGCSRVVRETGLVHATRQAFRPGHSGSNFGFRVARTLD